MFLQHDSISVGNENILVLSISYDNLLVKFGLAHELLIPIAEYLLR